MDKIENEEQYVSATQEFKHFKELWKTMSLATLFETKQFVSEKINNLNLLIHNYLQEVDRKKLDDVLFKIKLDVKINWYNCHNLNKEKDPFKKYRQEDGNYYLSKNDVKSDNNLETWVWLVDSKKVTHAIFDFNVTKGIINDFREEFGSKIIYWDNIENVIENLSKYVIKKYF